MDWNKFPWLWVYANWCWFLNEGKFFLLIFKVRSNFPIPLKIPFSGKLTSMRFIYFIIFILLKCKITWSYIIFIYFFSKIFSILLYLDKKLKVYNRIFTDAINQGKSRIKNIMDWWSLTLDGRGKLVIIDSKFGLCSARNQTCKR